MRYWAYSKERMQETYRRRAGCSNERRGPFRDTSVTLMKCQGVSPTRLVDRYTPGRIPSTSERLGYPTQKPEALLERIINASSNEGDVVLDPFCGCGTAVAVAERLNRRWIGIDITHLAISLLKSRLRDSFGEDLRPYQVIGVPQDTASARALAVESEHDGRYQFEWWALGLVDARPAQDRKKGADSGVDGYINFFDDNSGKPKRAIVQVKSGHVNRGQIATLKGDMEREKAEIGLFVTLSSPHRPHAAGRHRRRVLRAGALPRPEVPQGADSNRRGIAGGRGGPIPPPCAPGHLPPRPPPP